MRACSTSATWASCWSTGTSVDTALEKLMPGDFQAAADMKPKYSLLLDDDGGIIDDLMATRRGDDFYIVVNGATKHGDIADMERRLPGDVVIDHMKEQALLALQGPRAAEVLETIVPGVSELGFMQGGPFHWNGRNLWISRSGYTGEDGFEISVPAIAAAELADAIAANELVKPIGLGARDSLRLEAGLPLYGHDLDHRTTPVMAGLNFAINKRRRAEGGFAGAMRILAELENGAPQKRVGFEVEGRQPVREGALVLDGEGNEVGKDHQRRLLAVAAATDRDGLCRRAVSPTTGTALKLEQRGKLFDARVAAMPFVPHRYHRKGACRMSLYFTKDHEWVRVEGDTATVGISDHAQEQLGDIVFAEVPETGASFRKGQEAAVVESVKAASDVYSPVSGEVVEGNSKVADDPSIVNSDPEGEGWFFKVKLDNPGELDGLMDEGAYRDWVKIALSPGAASTSKWDAADYARVGGFVAELGGAALDLLDPKPGERILDVGCGEGTLTKKIAERGATVLGIDNSPEMVAAARDKSVDALLLAAEDMQFFAEFDAAFSNATLHWVLEKEQAARAIFRALKAGGALRRRDGRRGQSRDAARGARRGVSHPRLRAAGRSEQLVRVAGRIRVRL